MIKKVSKEYKPKLIHIQGYSGYYPIVSSSLKILLTLHDDPAMKIFDKGRQDPLKYFEFLWFEFIRFVKIRAIKKYDYFHALSTRIKKYLIKLGISKDNIFVIPNGIDNNNSMIKKKQTLKLGLNKKLKLIIMGGSIEHDKGTLKVAQSLKYLPEYFHLLLAGRPQPLIGIPYLKKVLNVDRKRIHYLGFLRKKKYLSLLNCADIYISASLFEACQLAPLEALTMKKKVITTTAGAILDFLPKNYPFLIKKHKPKEIADLILKASNTKWKYIKTDFNLKSWEIVGKEIKMMYSHLLKSPE